MQLVNSNFIRIAFAATFFAGVFSAANATSTAYAFDGKGQWSWASRTDQKSADRVAMNGCSQSGKNKDCKLDRTMVIVEATGTGRTGFGSSDKSVEHARKAALANCAAPDCRVTFETRDPGFYALALADASDGKRGAIHLAYGFDSLDDAIETATKKCAEKAGRECKSEGVGAIRGNTKSNSPPVRVAAPEAPSCRPKTAQIRCESNCVNGDCIVTYENGCKIRVQVQPRFDPFSNQWKYPSPSC